MASMDLPFLVFVLAAGQFCQQPATLVLVPLVGASPNLTYAGF